MKYSRFEALILGVGTITVLANIVFIQPELRVTEEVVAQLLLFGVLFGAVHWGRNGGLIAAVIASSVYFVLRIPLLVEAGGLTPAVASILGVRIITYGVIGILGGELCGRIKYLLARLENTGSIDEHSSVYNQRFIARILEGTAGQHARYATPFSVVLIEISPRVFDGLKTPRRNALIRDIAHHLRDDVRLVDEVGRLDDGRFLLVLPHTPKDGAQVAFDRLLRGVRHALGTNEDFAQGRTLSAPDEFEAITSLCATLTVEDTPES